MSFPKTAPCLPDRAAHRVCWVAQPAHAHRSLCPCVTPTMPMRDAHHSHVDVYHAHAHRAPRRSTSDTGPMRSTNRVMRIGYQGRRIAHLGPGCRVPGPCGSRTRARCAAYQGSARRVSGSARRVPGSACRVPGQCASRTRARRVAYQGSARRLPGHVRYASGLCASCIRGHVRRAARRYGSLTLPSGAAFLNGRTRCHVRSHRGPFRLHRRPFRPLRSHRWGLPSVVRIPSSMLCPIRVRSQIVR
jgi:hypothetical protein